MVHTPVLREYLAPIAQAQRTLKVSCASIWRQSRKLTYAQIFAARVASSCVAGTVKLL